MHTREEDQLRFEISFFEPVLERNPDNVECLKALAENYTRVGRYEDGLRADLHLARLCPGDPIVQYNLACSLSLTGQVARAMEVLSEAVTLGYRDFDHIRKDPDLSRVRELPAFRDLVECEDDA
jgi:Flp pilus assembly protein TadD